MIPESLPQTLDGVSVVALLVLVAFVVERIVSAILFVLVSLGALSDPVLAETPASRVRTERAHQWWRFLFSAALAVLVLMIWPTLRVLRFFGQAAEGLVDDAVTWVVILGGASQIAALVKLPGASAASRPPPPPIQVTGTLKLEDSRRE